MKKKMERTPTSKTFQKYWSIFWFCFWICFPGLVIGFTDPDGNFVSELNAAKFVITSVCLGFFCIILIILMRGVNELFEP